MASKVSYYFILIEISYCNHILTLEAAKRPFCIWRGFTTIRLDFPLYPLASIEVCGYCGRIDGHGLR